MDKRRALQFILIGLVTGGFVVGAHLLYQSAHYVLLHGDHNFMTLVVGLCGLVAGFYASRALLPAPGPTSDLDEAISKGDFIPYFQPIINLNSSQVSGFEMLARWTKPSGEIISPGRFIPLAENFGRIDALLFSLLRQSGRDLSLTLHENPDLKLTFNITPGQFLDPTFLPRLVDVATSAGLPLKNLVAEITERQEMPDLERACQHINQYKRYGIKIAIDDAGTGHNGLSCLQKLNVDTLKLDKFFIDGIVDNARARQMIEMLANLAKQYEMNVVAEGIETPDQAATAHAMGIAEGQGFYFSRPINAKNLLDLLAEQQRPLTQNNAPPSREKAASIRYAS